MEIACPFCGVISEPAVIEIHVEEEHAESGAGHLVSQDAELARQVASISDDDLATAHDESMPSDEFMKCTRPGCGEYIRIEEVDEHLEVHAALLASDENDGDVNPDEISTLGSPTLDQPKSLRKANKTKSPPSSGSRRGNHSLLDYFSGNSVHGRRRPIPQRHQIQPPRHPGRLGKRELGPHAFEDRMPAKVRHKLLSEALPRSANKIGKDGQLTKQHFVENETAGLIPILADLCAVDTSTQTAYFCSPAVKHIRKIHCDGNFCGYWSMQMLLSHLQASGTLPNMRALPSVLEMQDTIEQAWSNGILSYGRVETGGVAGTRKWIGTSEALAYFRQVGIGVEALSFKDDADDLAVLGLLDYVEAYFLSGLQSAQLQGTSHVTNLAPIYFQRAGHSMVIVGMERKEGGSRNLLVFDSSFETGSAVRMLLEGRKTRASAKTMLRAYRRSDEKLMKYHEFEVMVPTAGKS